jgi:uncharacterized membrane protein YhhN
MKKSLGVFWLSLSAVGSLICTIAIPGYLMWGLGAVFFAFIVYTNYNLQQSKKIFLVICAVNILVGAGLRWTPHDAGGGLTGFGILLSLMAVVPSSVFLAKSYKSEMNYETKNS